MGNKFTPGPWYEAKNGNGCQSLVIGEGTGENIAVSYKKENACLIASAPDLLAACEAALIFLNEEEYYQKSFEMTFVLEKLREASAKAKGE